MGIATQNCILELWKSKDGTFSIVLTDPSNKDIRLSATCTKEFITLLQEKCNANVPV